MGLISRCRNSPTDLGQNHELNELVLKKDGAVRPIFNKGNAMSKRVWIDFPATPLIDALLQEHGV